MAWNRLAPHNINRINAPAFAGAASVTGHPPPKHAIAKTWTGDHRRDKALRVTAPSLTTSNRTSPIGADRAIVAAFKELAAGIKDVLECISTVKADL